MFFLIFCLFYYENSVNSGMFFTSLPLSRKLIVIHRYIFLIASIPILAGYQYVLDSLVHYFFPMYLGYKPLHLFEYLLLAGVALIMINYFLPFLYTFSIINGLGLAFLAILVIGFIIGSTFKYVLTILDFVITIVTYQIAITFIILLAISLVVSIFIYHKKDITA